MIFGENSKWAQSSCIVYIMGKKMALSVISALVFYKKISLKEGEVWRKLFLNKIIATLVTQGLPSSLLCRPKGVISLLV